MATPLTRIQTAMAFTARNLDRDLSLETLAAEASISPFHLHRVFSMVAGETPKEFTSRLRFARASALLLSTKAPVVDIALASGFATHEGFTRAFRRRFGMTPRAYRARGFRVPTTTAQAEAHQSLIRRVGPCVGLFHVPQGGIRRRSRMAYTIIKKEIAPQPVLVERRRVNRSEIAATIGDVVSRIFVHAQQHAFALSGHPFTRYIEVGPGMVTIEPGMRVTSGAGDDGVDDAPGDESTPPRNVVRSDSLPGGFVVTTIHPGPYEQLPDAYAAIEAWMAAEGLTSAGAPWESYITDPAEHPDPMDWKTEVCWPVR